MMLGRRRTFMALRLIHRIALTILTVASLGSYSTAQASALGLAPSAEEESTFEELLARADEHASEGRHAAALDDYERAFAAMPATLRPTGVGEVLALAAGKAALEDYAAGGDARSLRRGRALVTAFLTVASTNPGAASLSLDAARTRLEEIDDVLSVGAPELEPEVEVEPEPEPAPGPQNDLQPQIDPAEPSRMSSGSPWTMDDKSSARRVGTGLMVAGALVSAGGAITTVIGGWMLPQYQPHARVSFLQERRYPRSPVALGMGLSLFAAGFVPLAIGICAFRKAPEGKRCGREKRSETHALVSPWLGREFVGMSIRQKL